jgi:anti-anti-sigma factor
MLGTYRVIGEIDLATAPGLTAGLRETIDTSREALVSVDCSGMAFMDSSGFHALVDATAYAGRRGHTLVIRNLSSSSGRLIRFCDWDHKLRVER